MINNWNAGSMEKARATNGAASSKIELLVGILAYMLWKGSKFSKGCRMFSSLSTYL